ncbi:hypothetical protein SARC_02968 [Sphaeroforma arctica JP610]|uniref:Uncharacterized protein n=1 Tax=Sphaeroforma arctica JP610 TaxID=667725 RepID=A0A0L0G716_9EUKA|nr:hypothetical protein SARC_02968 [Sphaeroforma arctica JP610]KNC84827.1 hypothetical protein SARC_02968 [Sphaeroforma arctica JP610]|eukprot:XP_014158729.1 hypothetical protein SARC_02968 [Sphaeroforma arctica JP610]
MSQRGRGRRKLCVARTSSQLRKPSPLYQLGRKRTEDRDFSDSLTSIVANVLTEVPTKTNSVPSVLYEGHSVDSRLHLVDGDSHSLDTNKTADECALECGLETYATPNASDTHSMASESPVDTNQLFRQSDVACDLNELRPIPEADSWMALLSKLEAEAKLLPDDVAEIELPPVKFDGIVDEGHAMRLFRDDMPIFGQYPLFDTLLTVRCRHCDDVVKESAFISHMVQSHADRLSPPHAVKFAHLALPPIGPPSARLLGRKRKKHCFIYVLKRTRATRGLLEANNIPAEAVTDSDRDSDVDKDTEALLRAHAYGCVCVHALCTCLTVRKKAVRGKRLKYDKNEWIPRRQSSRLQKQNKPHEVLR